MTLPLALLAALAIAVTPPPETPARLEVHFIDVGQGDGMLIRSPGGKTVLIDAGNVGAGSAVNDYLGRLGVEGLDLVIVSHPHMDHMGGLVEVLEKHPPKAYLDPGYAHPISQYDALLEWLDTNEIPVMTARAGRTITIEPGITLELFAPETPLLSGTRSDANSNSIVAKLVYDSVSFLFTGDAEDVTEQRVMRYTDKLESTVLKVAHHGGRHSTSDLWLSRVLPTWAVISAGAKNRYKHPTKETLGRLKSRGVTVFRTDQQGDIIARTDGKKLEWETTGELSAKLDEPGGRSSYRPPKPQSSASTAVAHPASKALVDVNTANEAALTTLPGIGKVTARKIIDDREQRGPFADLAALMRIRGIGKKTVDNIADHAEARPLATPASKPESRLKSPPGASSRDLQNVSRAVQSTTLPKQTARLFSGPTVANHGGANTDDARAANLLIEVGRLIETSRSDAGPTDATGSD